MSTALENRVRDHRERLGLSQQELSELVGVSRQAIVGIEGGRQVPGTTLSLRLARALRCGVEELFSLVTPDGLSARLAPGAPVAGGSGVGMRASGGPRACARVAVGEVDGSWVAHPIAAEGTAPADGIMVGVVGESMSVVRPLTEPEMLRRNVLVAGCAPILGMLVQRVGRRFADARATWLHQNSRRALDLLESRLVHVAGLHLSGEGDRHESLIRGRFPAERMLVVNLARWREGLVVPAGNPLDLRGGAGLLRPGLRFAGREEGAGAHHLLERLLAQVGGAGTRLAGPVAGGHAEVAQLVRCGAADVGVAIESVAVAAGLGFVPLAEERFDLVVPAAVAESPPVARLIQALDDPSFRAEMAHVPGYDARLSGQVTTLEAA